DPSGRSPRHPDGKERSPRRAHPPRAFPNDREHRPRRSIRTQSRASCAGRTLRPEDKSQLPMLSAESVQVPYPSDSTPTGAVPVFRPGAKTAIFEKSAHAEILLLIVFFLLDEEWNDARPPPPFWQAWFHSSWLYSLSASRGEVSCRPKRRRKRLSM